MLLPDGSVFLEWCFNLKSVSKYRSLQTTNFNTGILFTKYDKSSFPLNLVIKLSTILYFDSKIEYLTRNENGQNCIENIYYDLVFMLINEMHNCLNPKVVLIGG